MSKGIGRIGGRILRGIADRIHDELNPLSDRELKHVLKAVRGVSQTNCGWDVYHLAPGLEEIVLTKIANRRITKREEAAKGGE